MILTSLLLAVVAGCCRAADAQEGQKVSNLLPELGEADVPPLTLQSAVSRGRSDIEIEEEEEAPRGYFYPKPARPFNLPDFKTLDAAAPPVVSFAPEDDPEVERLPRSPRRRPQFPSPPPFVPGWIPPHHVRPLPALYARPGGY